MFSRKLVKPPSATSEKTVPSTAFSFNKILQKPINRSFKLGTCESGVRNTVIRTVEKEFAGEPFVAPFVSHLKKINADAFDPYSDLEFVLEEFSVRLVFQTIRLRDDAMTYTLPDCSLEPDVRLAQGSSLRKIFGWF